MPKNDSSTPAVRRPPRVRAKQPGDSNYDAGKARELKRRTTRAKQLRARADQDYWREGLEYMVIRDLRLYLQAGYGSFQEWILKGLKRSKSSVYERIAEAELYARSNVRRFGLDILELGRRYVALTADKADANWSPENLVVKVPQGGRIREVPFHKAGPDELEAAVAHQAVLAAARAAAAVPPQVAGKVEHLRAALKVPHSDRALADVETKSGDTGLPEDAELRFSLRFGDLESFIAHLAQALDLRLLTPRGRP